MENYLSAFTQEELREAKYLLRLTNEHRINHVLAAIRTAIQEEIDRQDYVRK